MSNGYFRWAVMVVMFAQLGCDGFTRKIDVDFSDHVTKGVIFSVLSNTDIRDTAFQNAYSFSSSLEGYHANRIYVSHSNPPGGVITYFYKTHTILQTEEDQLPLSFVDLDDEQQFNYKAYYGVEEELVPGLVYEVSSEYDPDYGPRFVPSWDPVSARDTMPPAVQFSIENVHLNYEEGNYWATPRSGYVDVMIEDEPDRTNAYLVDVSAIFPKDSTYEGEQYLVHSRIEPPEKDIELDLFDSSQDNLFREDDFTRDGRKRIHFRFRQTYGSHDRDKGARLLVRLSNLSGSFIRFQRSAQHYDTNYENPFAEPVEIYTNVENGYGIFALASRSYAEVLVK